MRSLRFFSAALVFLAAAAAACSSDSGSGGSTSPTTPTTPSTNGIAITVDTALAARTAVVGSVLPASVHVTQNGQPAPNISVTWTVSAGGGSVAAATTVSDASGIATNTWTLSDTARVSILTAGIVNVASVTLQATTTAGPPAAVVKVSADSVVVVAGATTLLTVRVTDKTGNPVPGVSVSWAASGGALTTTTTTTGSSGNGQVVFSTDASPKSYTVTATVAGIGALTFKVVGL
jgi:adhesin/invasin